MNFAAILISVIVAVIVALFTYLQHDNAPLVQALGSGAIALVGTIAALLTAAGAKGEAATQEPVSVFVGNLNFKATTEDLRGLFSKYGQVQSVRIMTDKMTRKPRGFAFVEMGAKDARRAIAKLDGAELLGRKLRVNEGKSRRETEQAA